MKLKSQTSLTWRSVATMGVPSKLNGTARYMILLMGLVYAHQRGGTHGLEDIDVVLRWKQLASQTFQCLQDGVSEALQDTRRDAFKLVTGKLQSSPFSEDLLMKVRKRIAALLRDPGDAMVRDTGQPFYLRLLAQWLEVFQDPDVDCLVNSPDSFATGVNVGVEDPLPRSPQIFPPKVKHRKLDDTEF